MTEQVSNKNWGEWGVLMFGALGIGTMGFLSTNLNDTISANCPEMKNSTGLTKASNVAIGTAIGIIIMAFSNKFNFTKTGMGRSGLLIAIAIGMLIIGAISVSPPSSDTGINLIDDEKAKTCSTQERLGTILLGFGLGIIVPALIKLFVNIKNKDSDVNSMKKNNELAVAFGTFILSLFATIVGSWSWNNFNKCNNVSNIASGFNGLATIITALLTIYCVVFGILRAKNNKIADYMSNFSKSKEFVMKRTMKKNNSDE